MIRSTISKMVRSMITTIINPFDGLLSRYFVTLDPVLNSAYEMAQPITFAGDFEIEFEFSTTTTGTYGIIIGSTTSQSDFLALGSTGRVRVQFGGSSLNGTILINDGKLHKCKVARISGVISVFVDGVLDGSYSNAATSTFNTLGRWATNTYYFNGIIANAKFTDQSGASDVVTTFKLDQATANTESSVEGNNSVTYVNIPQSARDLYTLDGNIWTDAVGNTIEVAE